MLGFNWVFGYDKQNKLKNKIKKKVFIYTLYHILLES